MNLTAFGNCMKRNREIDVPPLILKSGGGTVGVRRINENGKHVCDWKEY